ncbi:rab-GTPase-TBC domain-domain-containing protein [Coniella lustricola]|uniref:Rab-GTPase-TBC domain-domain-containing protein n=1 Tax=Coniella lustricola TaxID=2025994 RepID=A0A2T3AD90_9PEZI|nr:rab-GTPase-TBC domain-domain-containing protein [Coniella lustricola]
MMLYERPVEQTIVLADAGSPPGLSTSKSSKSSSFPSSRSFGSDRDSVITDVSNFEDIGLQDDAADHTPQKPKRDPSPYAASYASDLRTKSLTANAKNQLQPQQQPRALSKSRTLQVTQREIYNPMRRRSTSPNPRADGRDPHVRNGNTNQLSADSLSTLPLRNHVNRVPNSRPSVTSFSRRHRTPSPNNLAPHPAVPSRGPALSLQLRRSSWQPNRERKSEAELEKECDEDDGDDIPEGFVLDNVPLSPRPPTERTKSLPPSKRASPERPVKAVRVRSVGNGTPAVAAAHGSIGELRSPSARSDATFASVRSPDASTTTSPTKARANSWNSTLAALNKDAQELTEKLEEHAEEAATKSQRSSTGSIPKARRSNDADSKTKHKSALAELPPLRRSNIMIDPLPISKEKEAVLSRTRPSWLPPKDPAEERRHLKEYQKMMARSQESEKRKEAKKAAMTSNKDQAADNLMHIWEDDILPRFKEARREPRTRELWWRGVAPRSRGAVWAKAIGNDLGLSDKSFQAALGRAHAAEAREKAGHGSTEDHKYIGWVRAIHKDVEEHTWRDLRIFQAGGPLHQALLDVLSAYAMYRSDIGYVTGSNTIAAMLLLNTSTPAAAFIALANILNRPLPLSFHSDDSGAKSSAYSLMLQTLAAKSKNLYAHLTKLADHDADLYMNDIFTSLFTNQLALDEASRLWDVYVFEGDAVLIRAAVAILLDHEMALLSAKSTGEVQKIVHSKKQRLVGKPGDEDRWMNMVREAGKNNS